MKTQCPTYHELELIPDAIPVRSNFRQTVVKRIRQGWRWFVNELIREPEARVWQRKRRDGTIRWYAYDPTTGYKSCLSSEEEVRMWIETAMYRRNSHRSFHLDVSLEAKVRPFK